MSAYGIEELAIETAMVMHVEQITGGATIECHCGKDAVMRITSEPDMDPGPVCSVHAFQWIDVTIRMLRQVFPSSDGGQG